MKPIQSPVLSSLIILALCAGIGPVSAQVTFTTGTNDVGHTPVCIAALDVNGDGKVD